MNAFWGRLDVSSPTSRSCVSSVTSTCVIKMGCAVWGCLSERNPLSGVQQKNPYRWHQPCGPDSMTRSIIFLLNCFYLHWVMLYSLALIVQHPRVSWTWSSGSILRATCLMATRFKATTPKCASGKKKCLATGPTASGRAAVPTAVSGTCGRIIVHVSMFCVSHPVAVVGAALLTAACGHTGASEWDICNRWDVWERHTGDDPGLTSVQRPVFRSKGGVWVLSGRSYFGGNSEICLILEP